MCLPDHGRPSFRLSGQCALRQLLQTRSRFAVLQAASMGMGMGMMPPGQVSAHLHNAVVMGWCSLSVPRCYVGQWPSMRVALT